MSEEIVFKVLYYDADLDYLLSENRVREAIYGAQIAIDKLRQVAAGDGLRIELNGGAIVVNPVRK